jgi:hypothetical protein
MDIVANHHVASLTNVGARQVKFNSSDLGRRIVLDYIRNLLKHLKIIRDILTTDTDHVRFVEWIMSHGISDGLFINVVIDSIVWKTLGVHASLAILFVPRPAIGSLLMGE